MVVWVKALLFVAGGVTAAAGTAYVTGMLDPWLGREPVAIASLPQTTAPGEQKQPSAGEKDAVPLPEEAISTGKGDRIIAPSFDLLRVEPDGSLVVAGNAAGESTVEVLSGETVIGTAEAGSSGDFVIVLDEPLSPGDYQLSLRSMAGNVVSLSQETAVVSVPETPDGQVLALVDKPGAPAELVAVPQAGDASAPEEPAGETMVQAPARSAEDEDAEASVAQESPNTEDAQQQAAVTEDTAEPDEPAEAVAETQASREDEQVAAATDTTADGSEVQDEAAAPAAEEGAGDVEEQVTAAPPSQEASDGIAEQSPDAQPQVAVEAVEIEGGTIFVAGSASPGRSVRVYANDILLGDARASEAGRFLVEARHELPVGNYLIRADLLDSNGAVLARAAVPFDREPGETIAAVAPSALAQAQQTQDEQGEPAATEAPAAAEPETQQGEQMAAAPQQDEPATTTDQAAPAVDDAVSDGEEAAAAPGTEASTAPEPAVEAEATAPALERAEGSVIIRRGDSLWRISRRVYGRGVRYSTIYLANQDQIRDPDMIWPGQVFAVPQETPEGETADMDAIGDQAVAPDGEDRKAGQ